MYRYYNILNFRSSDDSKFVALYKFNSNLFSESMEIISAFQVKYNVICLLKFTIIICFKLLFILYLSVFYKNFISDKYKIQKGGILIDTI